MPSCFGIPHYAVATAGDYADLVALHSAYSHTPQMMPADDAYATRRKLSGASCRLRQGEQQHVIRQRLRTDRRPLRARRSSRLVSDHLLRRVPPKKPRAIQNHSTRNVVLCSQAEVQKPGGLGRDERRLSGSFITYISCARRDAAFNTSLTDADQLPPPSTRMEARMSYDEDWFAWGVIVAVFIGTGAVFWLPAMAYAWF